MTDAEFIKYLGTKLLNSGEDCCSICARKPEGEICDNNPGGDLDDNICIAGLREFADKSVDSVPQIISMLEECKKKVDALDSDRELIRFRLNIVSEYIRSALVRLTFVRGAQ